MLLLSALTYVLGSLLAYTQFSRILTGLPGARTLIVVACLAWPVTLLALAAVSAKDL